MIQLNPNIPVVVLKEKDGQPSGTGFAIGWIDYSQDHDLLWVVFMDDTRECWIVPNPLIRAQKNYSLGRNQ